MVLRRSKPAPLMIFMEYLFVPQKGQLKYTFGCGQFDWKRQCINIKQLMETEWKPGICLSYPYHTKFYRKKPSTGRRREMFNLITLFAAAVSLDQCRACVFQIPERIILIKWKTDKVNLRPQKHFLIPFIKCELKRVPTNCCVSFILYFRNISKFFSFEAIEMKFT